MTGVTGHILMTAIQRKTGVQAVIELQFLPIFRAMTFRAYISVAAVVGIIDEVASDTSVGRIFVMFIGMTQLAVEITMLAGQWIVGVQIMIEILLLPPLLIVALSAILTQLSIMRIIGFVTVETDGRGLAVFFVVLGMTKLASEVLVFTS
jgi:hypothetical protein